MLHACQTASAVASPSAYCISISLPRINYRPSSATQLTSRNWTLNAYGLDDWWRNNCFYNIIIRQALCYCRLVTSHRHIPEDGTQKSIVSTVDAVRKEYFACVIFSNRRSIAASSMDQCIVVLINDITNLKCFLAHRPSSVAVRYSIFSRFFFLVFRILFGSTLFCLQSIDKVEHDFNVLIDVFECFASVLFVASTRPLFPSFSHRALADLLIDVRVRANDTVRSVRKWVN